MNTNIESSTKCCFVPEHEIMINSLTLENAELKNKVSELTDQLSKNSSNSSKPPSSDGYSKPEPKSQRKKSGKKAGGQIGHKGETLEQVSNPDFIEIHKVSVCEKCGKDLEEHAPINHECRQEFELPITKPIVTEHKAEIKLCDQCAFITIAEFPENITQPVQYGPRVKAYSTYFNQQQFIAFNRLQDVFKDCFSLPISQGSMVNFNKKLAEKIEPSIDAIKNNIISSPVAHFDESGMKVNGKLQWLHVSSTKELTYYIIHEKRGEIAMNEMGILPNFKGVATHDHWAPYMNFNECDHSFCNAHHLREFEFAVDRYNQQWAVKIIKLLKQMNDTVSLSKKSGDLNLSKKIIEKFENQYSKILADGLDELPKLEESSVKKRGKKKQHKIKNLWDRMINNKKETLLFLHDFNVEFTNNLSEQDVRMCKVKQKISGTFRSSSGANNFAKIRSYISTARKQGQNIIDCITNAFHGAPFIPPH